MISLSDSAIAKVLELQSKSNQEGFGLRLRVLGGGCSGLQYSMGFDNEVTPKDKVIDVGGVKVYVDQKSLIYLVGTEIDYVDGLYGAGFKLNNPNAKNTCGCGKSFS